MNLVEIRVIYLDVIRPVVIVRPSRVDVHEVGLWIYGNAHRTDLRANSNRCLRTRPHIVLNQFVVLSTCRSCVHIAILCINCYTNSMVVHIETSRK